MSPVEIMVKKGTKADNAPTSQSQKLHACAKAVVVPPSATTDRAWICALAPAPLLAGWEDGSAGKWCVFRHNDVIDDAWAVVCKAVAAGRLLLAKVSTRLTAPSHGNIHVICIYTRDWRDDLAITAAREVLFELGFTEELGYKRDMETARGVYGTADEWYRRA